MRRKQGRATVLQALILSLGLAFACCLPHQALERVASSGLVVLHTNDHHGHPAPFYHHPAPAAGGLPARATLIHQIRKENKNVLVLDAGDLNMGRPESNLFKAKPDILGYNAIGYDAMALGNHEFDHPAQVLREQMSLARFPFLAANIRTQTGDLLACPYILKHFGEFKVAVLGLTTKDTKYIANPQNLQGLAFDDEIETARRFVPLLRKEADIVIALVHMGLFQSFRRGSKRLAHEVEGIDLIVDGHSHTRLEAPVYVKNRRSGRGVPIVQAWQWGLVLGRVDLGIRGKKVTSLSFRAIPVNLKTLEKRADGKKVIRDEGRQIPGDPALLKMLQPYVDEVHASLSENIGRAEGTFSHEGVRERETALGDLIADAMLWSTIHLDVDFALQNGGGIRAGLPRGPITKKTIHEMLPFDNTIVVLTMKGSDLIALFKQAGAHGRQGGAFLQVSRGVNFIIDSQAPRRPCVHIHGRPVDPTRSYKVATNSYLASGGDGYRVFLKALDSFDTSRFQRDVLIDYIKSLGGNLKPGVHKRIRVLGVRETALFMKRAA